MIINSLMALSKSSYAQTIKQLVLRICSFKPTLMFSYGTSKIMYIYSEKHYFSRKHRIFLNIASMVVSDNSSRHFC